MKVSKKLQEIIEKSEARVLTGNYVYCQLKELVPLGKHFMVSQDKDEVTVVTTEEEKKNLRSVVKEQGTYRLLELRVSVPFFAVGFLASVASAVAEKGCNILLISTFSKDYALIRVEQLDLAVGALRELGFKVVQ